MNTKFQEEYLKKIISSDFGDHINEILFVVTSANQSNSRYNPLPFWARAIGLDRFAQKIKEETGVSFKVIKIPHYPNANNFVDILLKETSLFLGGIILTPETTVVLCSTTGLIEEYQSHGFFVFPAEYDVGSETLIAKTPIEIVKDLFDDENDWTQKHEILKLVLEPTLSFWADYSKIPKIIERIWHEPLLTETGGLTHDEIILRMLMV